ncbi:MAG: hypothetical protein Q9N26_06610 [Aquificota bacterium]|nr:hypothetical protein [Aquificota bacterium]
MKAIGPYHYKVWVIGEVLDRYEECKNGARLPSSRLYIEIVGEEFRKKREAYFENVIIYAVDLEKLMDSLESPYREVIKGRYFEADVSTFMKDFGIKSRKEARRIIAGAVNRFFRLLERHRIR